MAGKKLEVLLLKEKNCVGILIEGVTLVPSSILLSQTHFPYGHPECFLDPALERKPDVKQWFSSVPNMIQTLRFKWRIITTIPWLTEQWRKGQKVATLVKLSYMLSPLL